MHQIAETPEQVTAEMNRLRSTWAQQRFYETMDAPADPPTYLIPNRNAAPVVPPRQPVDDEFTAED